MSVTIETIIGCDGGAECPNGGCHADGDMRWASATYQRKHYGDPSEIDSWVFRKGKDYCPDCARRLGFKPPLPMQKSDN